MKNKIFSDKNFTLQNFCKKLNKIVETEIGVFYLLKKVFLQNKDFSPSFLNQFQKNIDIGKSGLELCKKFTKFLKNEIYS